MTDSTESGTPQKSFRSLEDRSSPASSEPALLASALVAPTVEEIKYVATGEQTTSGRAVRRPALRVVLLDGNGERVAVARALVDSGADNTTLSTKWAKLLGIDLDSECVLTDVSVADKSPSARYAYQEVLAIEVLGKKMSLPLVMFGEDIPIALLGRRDFFARNLVLIDHPNHRFFIEPVPYPDDANADDDDDERSPALVLD